MPHLDSRYFFSQFLFCIIVLVITYITINKNYFQEYIKTLNNRNRFLNLHIREIKNISRKIKNKEYQIRMKRFILFEKVQNKIKIFEEKSFVIKNNQENNINRNIDIINLIHRKSKEKIECLLKKMYNKYYYEVRQYMNFFLNK